MESASKPKQSLFTPLKELAFRRLFIGQVLSDFGNWLDFTALAVLVVYTWGLGVEAVASLMFTMSISWVLLGPFLSVWVDRLPRRSMMIASALLRAAVVGSMIFVPNLYVLLPLVFLKGVLGAVNYPARQSAIRELVPEPLIPQAVALNQISFRVTQIVAPSLGGGIIALSGLRSVFAVEVFVLVLAGLFFLGLPRLAGEGAEASKERNFWAEFREGFQHIAARRQLSVAITLISVGFFIVFLYDGLLTVWTKEMALGEASYGLLLAAMGLGNVIGAVAAGQWTFWRNTPFQMMAGMAVLAGLINLVIGMSGFGYFDWPLAVWLGVFLVFGIVGAASTVPFGYILQAETPQHLMGRVSAVSGSIQNGAVLGAPAAGALLANLMGLGGVFLLAGVLMVTLALLVLLFLPRIVATHDSKQAEVA